MPRRKPVHPQPLKRSSEEGHEESPEKITPRANPSRKRRQTDEGSKSPGEGTGDKVESPVKPSSPTPPPAPPPAPPKQGSKSTPKKMRSSKTKSPTKECGEAPEADAAGTTADKADAGSAGADANARNLSLEALFQVTHSELENISRHKDGSEESPENAEKETNEKKEVPKSSADDESDPVVSTESKSRSPSPAPVASETVETETSSTSVSKQTSEETVTTQRTESEELVSEDQADDSSMSGASAHMPVKALQICTEIPETSSDGVEECEVTEGGSPSSNPQTVVRLPVSEKGVEKYQLKSDTLEEQGLKLIYTKKTYDQYEPNPISYGTYKPRSYKATSQVVDPALQESGVIQVGRKRKHPPKPGRHICPYCGRGCAKPSVLQKHIRAHTGERPYPCIPCGFSFKTKSNLYKHCKSRAHANKAGLTPNVDDPSKGDGGAKTRDDSLEGELDDGESEDTDGESHEDDGMSDSSALELSKSGSVEIVESSPVVPELVEVLHLDPKSSDPVIIEVVTADKIPGQGQISHVGGQGQGEHQAKVKVQESQGPSVRTSRLIKTDKQYYDIAYVNQDSQILGTVTAVGQQNVMPVPHKDSTKQVTAAQSRAASGSPQITLPATTVVSVTSRVEKESDNSMKVTIQLPKPPKGAEVVYPVASTKTVATPSTSSTKGQTGSVLRRSASLPDQLPPKLMGKDSKGKTPEALRERLAQLQGVPPKPLDHKSMTPEMLRDRITQLITANAAIIDMPMADAPRPKRMSRQNSEASPYRHDPGTPGVGAGPSRGLLQSSLSLDSQGPLLRQSQAGTKPAEFKILEVPKGVTYVPASQQEPRFLGQAEPTDQPPGMSAAELDPQSQKVAELVAAAKNATPVPAVSLSALPPTSSAPQEIKIQFKLAKLPTDSTSPNLAMTPQPMIGQPGVQFPSRPVMLQRQLSLPQTQSADSSVIRDLLLKGRPEKTLTKSESTPVQMLDEGDVGQVVVVEDRGNPVTYFTHSAQELVPMQVAEDVEVMSSGETLRSAGHLPRAQLKRAMSLPQGIAAGSHSPSPYGAVIFDNYDPSVPPRRGRPKGSKNRPKHSPSLLGSAPLTMITGSQSPAIYTSTMRMPLVAQAVTSPGVGQSRPPLRLTIPPPSINQSLTPTVNSAGVLSGMGTGTPQGETPNSLWKLKLKGKLLMKRSMSVERMLSQERERQGVPDECLPLTPSNSISSPLVLPSTLAPTNQSTPLRRAESADEVTPLKKRRIAYQSAISEDSPMKRMLVTTEALTHPVMGSNTKTTKWPLATENLSLVVPHRAGGSPEVVTAKDHVKMDIVDKSHVIGKLRGPVLSLTEPAVIAGLAKVGNHCMAPTNQYQPFQFQTPPFVAPFLQLGRQEAMQLPQSMYLSLKLSPTMSNILLVRTPSDEVGPKPQTLETSTELPSLPSTDELKTSETSDVTEKISGEENVVEREESKSDLEPSPTIATTSVAMVTSPKPEVSVGVVSKQTKEMTLSLASTSSVIATCGDPATPQTPLSSKPLALSEKGLVQVLLLGHQCPMLRMHTHSTFCTLSKPQPMYVLQEASRKLSMYSNWRVARYNPNPMGLSSRELMSLHHHRLHDNEPHFSSPTMGPSKTGILTHSSYWNYYNKMRVHQPKEERNKGVDDVRIIKQVPEVKMATEVRIAEEQDQQKVTHHSPMNVAMETTVVTTPAPPKAKGKEHKRMRIFAGGYKTNEEYIYVRGRGRGKYVCEECGIRCKKPSMLKKHIRTHTDLRPYHCKHCTFSFKTKGNLTKHMKSKAHHKKCIELGILPVPVTVDDSQIDSEALARQVALAKEGKWPSEDDGQFSDGDDDEDEDEDGEDSEADEETMMIVDTETGQVKETLSIHSRSMSEENAQYVALQESGTNHPTLVQIDPKTQTTVVYQIETSAGPQVAVSTEGENENPESDEPRPSIDKEIAHSLLDLSKGSDSQKTTKSSPLLRTISVETKRLLRQHSAAAAEEGRKEKKESKEEEEEEKEEEDGSGDKDGADGKGDGTRLDTLIGALMCRTGNQADGNQGAGAENEVKVGPSGDGSEAGILNKAGHLSAPLSMVRMATTIYQSLSVRMSSDQTSTSDLLHIHRRSNNTYAQKIAALQSANENDLRMTMKRPTINTTGSGFVPPILLMGPDGVQRIVLESPMTPGSRAQPLLGHLLKRGSSEGASSDLSVSDKDGVQKAGTSGDRPMNLSVRSSSSEDGSLQEVDQEKTLTKSSTSPSQTPVSSSVHYMTGENRAPFEIYPIAGKSRETSEALIDGKYLCQVCDKVFTQYSQLALHKNIHFFERPYRCEGCVLSFRTKANLQKHQRSEMHQAKQSVNQQFGAPTSDNPRPYKCEECEIAFRIHGHLAKHFRSKSHITTMERLGKVAPGTSADSDLELIEDDSSIEQDEDSQGLPATESTHKDRGSDHPIQPPEGTPNSQIGGSTVPTSGGITSRKVVSAGPGTRGPSPIQDQFHYHKLSGYEKDIHASNEKVTVEKIKSEPIDIGAICPLGTRTDVEPESYTEREHDAAERAAHNREVFRHQAGAGSGEQHPHKCGICGKTFRAMSVLKQHLVTHAELRPYVCEYCDAGFTTAQSLKFHLRTHTQERPYICGQCGDTFARSDNLRNHMHTHEDREDDPSYPRPTHPPQEGAAAKVSTQLVRSASADVRPVERRTHPTSQALVQHKSLQEEPNTAAQRRMAFSSSVSLPLALAPQSVKLVPLTQAGTRVTLNPAQIMQQSQLGLVRMPMLSVPIPQRAQYQTVMAAAQPNTSPQVQTLLLSSPVALPSVIQHPGITTSTITMATATAGRSITTTSVTNRPEPCVTVTPTLIPTVVIDKEQEPEVNIPYSSLATIKPLVPHVSVMQGQAPVVAASAAMTSAPTDGTVWDVPTLTAGSVTVSMPETGPQETSGQGQPVYMTSDSTVETSKDGNNQLITTKLVPPDRMQEELLQLLEQQGMSLDKVQLLQVKDGEGENENLQLVIIECDDHMDEAHGSDFIASTVSETTHNVDFHHVVTTAASPVAIETVRLESASGLAAEVSNSEVGTDQPQSEPVTTVPDNTDNERSEAKASANGLTSEIVPLNVATDADHVEYDMLAADSGNLVVGTSTVVRQRGMLKRQHSVDIADQSVVESSLNNSSDNSSKTAAEKNPEQPPAKVLIQQSHEGHCIPRPLTPADPKGQEVSD